MPVFEMPEGIRLLLGEADLLRVPGQMLKVQPEVLLKIWASCVR